MRWPYTVVAPPLGALALVTSIGTLLVSRQSRPNRRLPAAAIVCLALGTALTVGVHFPINAAIDTWDPTAPPPEWNQVHDRWLLAHTARSVLALSAFVLLMTTATRRQQHGNRSGTSLTDKQVLPTLP